MHAANLKCRVCVCVLHVCVGGCLWSQNCNLTGNTNSAGSGGAVALIGGRSETTFEACNFVQNAAETTAASHGLGGAVFVADLSLCTFLANCTFLGNTASPSSRQGGGGTIDPSAGAGGALAVVNSGPWFLVAPTSLSLVHREQTKPPRHKRDVTDRPN